MNAGGFIRRQVAHVQRDGVAAILRKVRRLGAGLFQLPVYVIAVPVVICMRLFRPWFLVRVGPLISSRLGHFASNTELYLCELEAGINSPERSYADILYFAHTPICNKQLAKMWSRTIRVWPSWIMVPIYRVNRVIPGGEIHEVGGTAQSDRDIHNLFDRVPGHLQFTAEEEAKGAAGLRRLGIPEGALFVCLIVRDSAYLSAHLGGGDYSYHDYRDSHIRNYVLAAEELARRGYYVVRMGAVVHEKMPSRHEKVIDYATNGMRSDFMDVFLGAKCQFCISVGTGFDAIPQIFRRPIVFVNTVPLGYLLTFRKCYLSITKHHYLIKEDREMSLGEIFSSGAGLALTASDYASKGINLVENSPEEIRDAVVEMVERLEGAWREEEADEMLQRRFWEIYPAGIKDATGRAVLHGEIRGRFGANFLRANPEWLR